MENNEWNEFLENKMDEKTRDKFFLKHMKRFNRYDGLVSVVALLAQVISTTEVRISYLHLGLPLPGGCNQACGRNEGRCLRES